MADEFDSLVEQIVIDDAEALGSLANFNTALATTQEKIAGLTSLIQAVATNMGTSFDAATAKVAELNNQVAQTMGGNKAFSTTDISAVITQQSQALAAFKADTAGISDEITKMGEAWRTSASGVKMYGEAQSTAMTGWQKTLASFPSFDTERGKIDALKQSIREYSAENGVSFEKAGVAVKKYGEATGTFTNDTSKHFVQAQKEMAEGAMGVTGELEKLGTMFVRVWTAMLAFQVIQWVMQLFTGFKQAVTAALDFANTMNLVVVAVRNLQSAGMDVTLKQVNEQLIALKKQFPIFTEQDIAAGFKDLLLKTSSMNLSFSDTTKIMQIAMGTSLLMGKTVEQTSDAIIKGMINVNKQSVKSVNDITSLYVSQQDVVAKATEMGIKNAEDGYTALTEQEKALAYLNAAYDEYVGKQKDISAIMGTTAVESKTLSATWADGKKNLGLMIEELPAFKAALEFLNAIIPPITQGIVGLFSSFLVGFQLILTPLAALEGYFVGVWAYIQSGGRNALEGIKIGMQAATEATNLLFEQINKTAATAYDAFNGKLSLPSSPLGDNPIGAVIPSDTTDAQDRAKQIATIEADAKAEIIRIQDEFVSKSQNIEEDYSRKLEDIALKRTRALEDLETDRLNKIADIQAQANEEIAKKQEKNRQDDIDAEEKYQLQMQELRENFMLSLNDALRERDAKNIIRLIDQYNLEKKQATDKYNLDTKQRHEADAAEIADTRRQTADKMAALERDIAQRRSKIEEQYQQEKTDAATWKDRQMEDLKKDTADRLKQWADLLQAQYDLTDAEVKAIYANMKAYFGPNGYVDQLYNYLLAKMAAVAGAMSGLGTQAGPGHSYGGGANSGFANGGTLFADTPKTVTFGEAGPEVAMFIPLRNSMPSAPSSSINVGGMGGSLALQLLLDPNLEAKIVQTSLTNVALTIDRVQRQQK